MFQGGWLIVEQTFRVLFDYFQSSVCVCVGMSGCCYCCFSCVCFIECVSWSVSVCVCLGVSVCLDDYLCLSLCVCVCLCVYVPTLVALRTSVLRLIYNPETKCGWLAEFC